MPSCLPRWRWQNRCVTRFNLAAFFLLIPLSARADEHPTLLLSVGTATLQVEIAATPRQQEQGLMARTHLDEDAGMLFIFERKSGYCFWMKDTLIPLSVAFLDDDGRVVNLADMQPMSTTLHCPDRAVRYALEANQGWFGRQRIQPGMRVNGLPPGIN